MGLTHVTASIRGLSGSDAQYEAEFLVDTRTTDCFAPADQLRAAGVVEAGRRVYELANGALLEYAYGFARIAFFGSETVTPVIFGPDGTEPLLGVIALEGTGIGVDPTTKSLKRMAAIPLK